MVLSLKEKKYNIKTRKNNHKKFKDYEKAIPIINCIGWLSSWLCTVVRRYDRYPSGWGDHHRVLW
jgi:hypothetical protein